MKLANKEDAIRLRREGKSYKEILEKIPVAKSTLSLWLRDVLLTHRQIHRLTEKKRLAQLKGGQTRHAQKLAITASILESAISEVGTLSHRERWLVGATLYWAEGCKEKSYGQASGVDFANTDALMVKFFVEWLRKSCSVPEADIYANMYIHEYQKDKVPEALRYWSKASGLSQKAITGVYFKKHNPKTSRHNYSEMYYGTLRVRVRRSSSLMRKIQGWVNGMCE